MRGSGCYAPMSYYNGSYVPRQPIREGESAGNLLLRTETCLNDPYHLAVGRKLANLPPLKQRLAAKPRSTRRQSRHPPPTPTS